MCGVALRVCVGVSDAIEERRLFTPGRLRRSMLRPYMMLPSREGV
jgi:hypothetical protein